MLMFIIQTILIAAVLAVFVGAGLYKDDYGDFAGWKPKKKCLLALIPLGIWVLTLSVLNGPRSEEHQKQRLMRASLLKYHSQTKFI